MGGTAPTSVRQFVRATNYPLLGKVWLSSVCWSPSVKPGNEAKCRIYWEWVKMAVEFEAVCGPKFMTFWDDVTPCSCQRTWSIIYILFRSEDIGRWICRVRLRSRPKKVVLGPPICRGKGYSRFRTCIFKLHLLPSMWPIFIEFRSVTSEIRRRKK